MQNYIPLIRFRSQIGTEAAFIIPNDWSHAFPTMLSDLEKSMEELKIAEYGLSISSLDEVYIKVCAGSATGEIDFNMELINCNRFRLHTGIRLYLAQWKAMIYKRFLVTLKPPTAIILQTLVITLMTIAGLLLGKTNLSHFTSDLNISLSHYENSKILLSMSNDTDVKLKMQPLTFYLGDYFRKFQEESTLTFVENITKEMSSTTPLPVDVYRIGGIEFGNTENVTIHFNNIPLHSIPIMVLLWINAVTKFELGEEYNVEVWSNPLEFKLDNIHQDKSISDEYAKNVILGLSLGFAFFGYYMTKVRVGRLVLLQLLGGVWNSTLWLSNLLWDMFTLSFFVSIIVLSSFIAGSFLTDTPEKAVQLFFILMYSGFGVILFAYLFSLWFKDPALCVSVIAFKDFMLILFVFPSIKRIRTDPESDAIYWIGYIFDSLFRINPCYGTMTILQKMNNYFLRNASCQATCNILKSRFRKQYRNCSTYALCNYEQPMKRSYCCCEYTTFSFFAKVFTALILNFL